MRFRVKPHSGILAFFPSTRGPSALAIGPSCRPVRAGSVLASFPTRRIAGTSALVGGILRGPSATPGQPSIRVAFFTNANTPYLVRSWRTGRPIQSPPIERTAPLQDARRQNGDSLRRAGLATITRLPSGACASGAAGSRHDCLLGVTPGGRAHVQAPVLFLGPVGQLALVHIAPERDQEHARQGHDADFACPFVARAETPLVPLTQRAGRLPAPPQPGQLDDQRPHMLVARLADALLTLALA